MPGWEAIKNENSRKLFLILVLLRIIPPGLRRLAGIIGLKTPVLFN